MLNLVAFILVLDEVCRFNKRREDFADLRAYNDYLEEVEDIGKTLAIYPVSANSRS